MLQGLSMGEPRGPSLSSLTDSEVFGASLLEPLVVACGGVGTGELDAPALSANGNVGSCSLMVAVWFLLLPLPDLVRCGVVSCGADLVVDGGVFGGNIGGKVPFMLWTGS